MVVQLRDVARWWVLESRPVGKSRLDDYERAVPHAGFVRGWLAEYTHQTDVAGVLSRAYVFQTVKHARAFLTARCRHLLEYQRVWERIPVTQRIGDTTCAYASDSDKLRMRTVLWRYGSVVGWVTTQWSTDAVLNTYGPVDTYGLARAQQKRILAAFH
jgi:hypothetical protein